MVPWALLGHLVAFSETAADPRPGGGIGLLMDLEEVSDLPFSALRAL